MKYLLTLLIIIITINTARGQSYVKIGIVNADYLYQMSGKINNLEIDMFYRISQNLITGYYYYKKYYNHINIIGYVKNDTVQIFEFDTEANKTGMFKGRVKDNSTFYGDWTNLKNLKKMPFELTGTTTPFEDLKCRVFVKNSEELKFYNFADSLVVMPFDFTLLDYSKKNGDHFFLFKIGSSSKPFGNGNGYCGAGFEEKLVLIKTDNRLNILKESSYLINSCFYNYSSSENDIDWEEGKWLKIKGTFFKDSTETKFIITYDKSNPENGLKIEYINED